MNFHENILRDVAASTVVVDRAGAPVPELQVGLGVVRDLLSLARAGLLGGAPRLSQPRLGNLGSRENRLYPIIFQRKSMCVLY